METNRFENNQVTISGEIISGFEFDHELFGEKFYITKIATKRHSGTKDILPVMVSDRLFDVKAEWIGQFVKISGQFRSYNKHEEKSRLILSVFAREIETLSEDDSEILDNENEIFLDGYICKEPIYRKTPLDREIADMLIAVNRPYRKSDYIPCVAWGRNARFADGLEVGTRLKIWGRIQSREYEKKVSDNEYETRVAYEMSISKMEVADDE